VLVLRRKEGQWIDIVHKNGDKLRVRVYRIKEGYPSQLDMAFDDEARNFEIQRPERRNANLLEDCPNPAEWLMNEDRVRKINDDLPADHIDSLAEICGKAAGIPCHAEETPEERAARQARWKADYAASHQKSAPWSVDRPGPPIGAEIGLDPRFGRQDR
jgi:hypothetical protein